MAMGFCYAAAVLWGESSSNDSQIRTLYVKCSASATTARYLGDGKAAGQTEHLLLATATTLLSMLQRTLPGTIAIAALSTGSSPLAQHRSTPPAPVTV
jgi:hypothetical protein